MPTILVADDEPCIREVVRAMLEEAGYRVLEAASVASVLETLAQEQPELILADCLFADSSGRDLGKEMNQTPGAENIPILLISGLPELDLFQHARMWHAIGYLQKPFLARELVRRVNQVLAGRPRKAA